MRSVAYPILAALLLLAAAPAQSEQTYGLFQSRAPADNPTTDARVELGRQLFNSGMLSDNGKVSCATCHDPSQGFSDGLGQAVGVAGFPVGRNSASLTVAGLIERFPGLERVRSKDRRRVVGTRPAVLTLEERCLAPITNAVEMGSSMQAVIKKLRRVAGMNETFDNAFEKRGKGVTEERMGKALAAFLRTQEPARNAPYRRFLEGDGNALTRQQKRGLSVFNGRGRCNRCHSGPALTDGLVHVAALPTGTRTTEQSRANRARVSKLMQKLRSKKVTGKEKKRKEEQLRMLVGGGPAYYGPNPQIGGQTPSLWNISQTGPYFRDGSMQDLRSTVLAHIDELQEVALAERQRRAREGGVNMMTRVTAPTAIRVGWGRRGPALPDDLDQDEFEDLIAFLKSL